MTLEELLVDLRAAGCNANTLQLAANCYEVGRKDGRKELRQQLYTSLTKMPLNDTAHSIAVWIKDHQ